MSESGSRRYRWRSCWPSAEPRLTSSCGRLAAVFEKLGFETELTPASKDGDKDIILGFKASDGSRTYVVEVKHWRSRKKVGEKHVTHFVEVIAAEGRVGGLYLSTYGYASDAFKSLTEVERKTLRFGSEEKIAALCKMYLKAESGLWTPQPDLEGVLYEGTE